MHVSDRITDEQRVLGWSSGSINGDLPDAGVRFRRIDVLGGGGRGQHVIEVQNLPEAGELVRQS